MLRDFKGIWIPKELWLNKELTIMEKIFLIEIDSLDNKEGCFATNRYFAEFFDMSIPSCSRIINSLKEKEYIDINIELDGKQVKKRTIKVTRGGILKMRGGGKKTKYPPFGNEKGNNTVVNNTIKKEPLTPSSKTEKQFNVFWKYYNYHVDKQKCFDFWNTKMTPSDRRLAVKNSKVYAEHTIKDESEQDPNNFKPYRKIPFNWLEGRCWEDEIVKRGVKSGSDNCIMVDRYTFKGADIEDAKERQVCEELMNKLQGFCRNTLYLKDVYELFEKIKSACKNPNKYFLAHKTHGLTPKPIEMVHALMWFLDNNYKNFDGLTVNMLYPDTKIWNKWEALVMEKVLEQTGTYKSNMQVRLEKLANGERTVEYYARKAKKK